MDRVTFDFETGEIIFDTDGQKGVEIDLELKNKRGAIMAAAGYEQIPMSELRDEINQLCAEMGINARCVEPTDKLPADNPKSEDGQDLISFTDVLLTLLGEDVGLLPKEEE